MGRTEIGFVCAHCGKESLGKVYSIENGTALICESCGKTSVVCLLEGILANSPS